MNKINAGLNLLLIILISTVFAMHSYGAEKVWKAKKLFPQITEGIVNAENKLAMNCQIASDGVTVTDKAWNTYLPGEDKAKRWSFNQTPYTDEPLINYKFPDQFSGLQVTINVEIYRKDSIWTVTESYQEILQLGGKRKLALPTWFDVPQTGLAYDFDEGYRFPRNWKIPKGKFACWEGAGKYDQKDRNGHNPMLDYGFTHIAEINFSAGGTTPSRKNWCRLFGDAEWLDMDDGGNYSKWHNRQWKDRAKRMEIVIPDFENADHWRWNQQQYDAFRDLVTDFKKDFPNTYIGCWGMGVVGHSYRIFDERDESNVPTGVVNLKAAAQWKAQYDNPNPQINPILDYCGLNFGNPAVYWMKGGNPAHLYAVVQEWEIGKLARPNIPNVLSTWIQTEFVDGYPLTTYRFTAKDGSTQVRYMKHQAPPSLTYAMSLFAHTRMDGAYCWETGNIYSEDLADVGVIGADGMEVPVRRTVNGIEKNVYYYLKYFGFYNYHVLGMWQASTNRSIIEANTQWIMPEIWTSTGKTWRTGDERYTSYCNYYKEPLIRVKTSADSKRLLVVACNPYNRDVQKVKIRLPGTVKEHSFDLIGDYPIIKVFK